jgi:hypothetical protein
MGEVNRAHATEVAVGCQNPKDEGQSEMAGVEQRHSPHARLHKDHASHVILRNPVLATRHPAQFTLIDRRRVV